MNGSTQLAVDRWVQELNPDRHAGSDYVTSFTLQMQPAPNGTLTVTAPAPGRYRIATSKGGRVWEATVLVRPDQASPGIRAAIVLGAGRIDRPYATQALILAKRA